MICPECEGEVEAVHLDSQASAIGEHENPMTGSNCDGIGCVVAGNTLFIAVAGGYRIFESFSLSSF